MKRILSIGIIAIIIIAAVFCIRFVLPGYHYAKGASLRSQEKWDDAIAQYTAAGTYADAAQQILETHYQKATSLYEAGDYSAAYAIYLQIENYKNVSTILQTDTHFKAANEHLEEVTAPFRNTGSRVTFGHYEQDNNLENGSEPIEWIILDATDDRVLLVSRYALDCIPYHSKRSIITWEKSSIRHWLNSDFLSSAFSDDELTAVLKSTVDNSQAQSYEKHSGNSGSNTMDKVFLLSYAEAWKYFPTDESREALPTAYAVAHGAYVSPINGNCWWWLRSIGNYGTCAANVHYNGVRGDYLVNDIYAGVRPAIWVNLHSEYFTLPM